MSINNWVEIVHAAGFDADSMQLGDVYLLSGRIIHDSVIVSKKQAIARSTGRVPLGATLRFVQQMTEAERADLRERVSRS